MASLNKVILIGNLGRDPELKYTPGGQAVTTFTLATTRRWRDKEGGNQEDTQWHNIKVWARQAEVAHQYLKKGRQIYVEGRIETRSYDDKDGNRKWFTEIVAQQFLMLGSKRDEGAPAEDYGSPAPAGPAPAPSGDPGGGPPGGGDDVPF